MEAIRPKKRRAKPTLLVPAMHATMEPAKRFVLTIGFLDALWMKALTPHAEGHWRGKTKATGVLRHAAGLEAHKVRGDASGLFVPARLTYRFYYPSNIQRDEANMIQRMKPVIDGLVDAGVIIGDHWQVLSTAGVVSAIDKANPRIEIIIEAKEQA